MNDTTESPSPESSSDGRTPRSELFVVIVMGVTAVLTAWAGFQGARWSGAQSTANTQANAARTESVRESATAGYQRQIDVTTFVAWVDAIGAADQERADFIETRFTDRLEPAFEAWRATDPRNNPDAPATPFELPEYVVAAAALSDELSTTADTHAAEAATASSRVDRYVTMSVLFALVLFFTSISTKLSEHRNRMFVLDIAIVGVVIGAIILALSPIKL